MAEVHGAEGPMRICAVLASGTGHGGIGNAVGAVLRGLQQRGHEVRLVLAQESSERDWYSGIPAACGGFPLQTGRLLREAPAAVSWLRGQLRGMRPDVVLATEARAVLLCRSAMPLRRPPLLSWLHTGATVKSNRWVFGLCDGHIAVSRGLGRALGTRAPMFALGNPVALDVPAVPRPQGAARFVYVGHLVRAKGVHRILRALAGVQGEWRLQVFGRGGSEAELRAEAEALGLADRVEWRGFVHDPWGSIAEASALVLASESEGLPLVLLEAAARGVPLVAMDCDHGPREIVTPENGWLVPAGDTAALSLVLGRIASGGTLPMADAVRASVSWFGAPVVAERFESVLRASVRARLQPAPTRSAASGT